VATVGLYVLVVDRQSMPASRLANLLCYEDFISTGSEKFEWPDFDELSASSLFYTSGTTGNPKGVLYSHRSDVLHALTLGGACGFGFLAQGYDPADDADVPRQRCLGIYPCGAMVGANWYAGPQTRRGQHRRVD